MNSSKTVADKETWLDTNTETILVLGKWAWEIIKM